MEDKQNPEEIPQVEEPHAPGTKAASFLANIGCGMIVLGFCAGFLTILGALVLKFVRWLL